MIKTYHARRSCFYLVSSFSRCQHTKAVKQSIKVEKASVTSQNEVPKIEKVNVMDQIQKEKKATLQTARDSFDDQEKFPAKLEGQKENLILKKIGNLKFIQAFRKKSAPKQRPPTTEFSNKQGSSVIFTDDEPVDLKSDNLVTVDIKDPSLWHSQDGSIDIKQLPKYYLMLSKSRLTLLVCITSAAGYGLASAAAFDPVILTLSTIGVGLTSAAANATNQTMEVPFDSQMNRTRNRVLVKGLITPWHAMAFASVSGISGAVLLWNFVNPPASLLALANLFLYTSVYTPMKRLSIYNTWVGSVVGAIPPVIGWVSATGTLDAGALVLGGILYTWQFPHFNSLSWNLRPDYSRAGYRMMSVTDPELCKRVALRHSIGCLLVCSIGAPILDVTSYAFAVDSLPLNAYLVYLSWKFYEDANSSSSRKLFRYTLVHLPLLMILMFISRKRTEKIHAE